MMIQEIHIMCVVVELPDMSYLVMKKMKTLFHGNGKIN